MRVQGWRSATWDLHRLLPALAHGNRSMEGKKQLSENPGSLERELISPPAAYYCHEIKCFVLFGECQPSKEKTKEEKAQKKKQNQKQKASRCRCWNLFARLLYQCQENGRLFATAGVHIAQLNKRSLVGAQSQLLPAEYPQVMEMLLWAAKSPWCAGGDRCGQLSCAMRNHLLS